MNILTVIGIGLVCAVLCVLLRQVRPELALLLSLAGGIFILLSLFTDVLQIIGRVEGLMARVSVPNAYAQVLLKALGICFLTQLACDTCKDAGESAIATKIEIAGKIAVLVVSLPLFEQALSLVFALISPEM